MDLKVVMRIIVEAIIIALFPIMILVLGTSMGLASGNFVIAAGWILLSVIFAYRVLPYRKHIARWKKELNGNNKN